MSYLIKNKRIPYRTVLNRIWFLCLFFIILFGGLEGGTRIYFGQDIEPKSLKGTSINPLHPPPPDRMPAT